MWFETKVRYEKMMEDGKQKRVTETYVVDALSFGEAEERITEEMSVYISGEFDVKAITPTSYGEIFFSENTNDDRWYKAKLSFITIDEKTEKEKRTSVYYLVQASSLKPETPRFSQNSSISSSSFLTRSLERFRSGIEETNLDS